MKRTNAFAILLLFLSSVNALAQNTSALVGSGYPESPSHAGFAPGQIVTLRVTGLNIISPAFTVQRATAVPLPTQLGGVSVILKQSVITSRFDSPTPLPPRNAALLSVSQSNTCSSGAVPIAPTCILTLITAQLPFELNFNETGYPQYPTSIVISQQGTESQAFAVGIDSDWIHVVTNCDQNPDVICTSIVAHVDGTLVSLQSPAKPGETVIVYVWGLGPTIPSVKTGESTPEPAPIPSLAGFPGAGVPVQFDFRPNAGVSLPYVNPPSSSAEAFLTPGQVGLYQIHLHLPAVLPKVDLCSSDSGIRSNLTVNLWGLTSFDAAALCVEP